MSYNWTSTWATTIITALSWPTIRGARGNCPELKATKFIYDYFNLERRKDFYKKFQQTLDHYFPGLDRKAVHEAIDAAYDEYARHMQQLRDKGTEIIAQARREGRRIIVLAGRPYHVDPEVNHGIDQLIIRQGAAVISEDSVSCTSRSSRPPS